MSEDWPSGLDLPDAHDPKVLGWLQKFLREGDVYYDIGAHRGIMTKLVRSCIGKGRIVAIEPNAKIFLELLSCFREDPDCTLICAAAWSRWEMLNFTPSKNSGSSMVGQQVFGHIPYAGHIVLAASLFVSGIPLDGLVERGVIRLPNFIKSDTQGSELEWMKGASELLRSPALRGMIFECDDNLLKLHKSSSGELLDFVKGLGFRIVETEGDDVLALR